MKDPNPLETTFNYTTLESLIDLAIEDGDLYTFAVQAIEEDQWIYIT
jgi:hypothetical protein